MSGDGSIFKEILNEVVAVKVQLALLEDRITKLEKKVPTNQAIVTNPFTIVDSRVADASKIVLNQEYATKLLREDGHFYFSHIIRNWNIYQGSQQQQWNDISSRYLSEVLKDFPPKQRSSFFSELVRRERNALRKAIKDTNFVHLENLNTLKKFLTEHCYKKWGKLSETNNSNFLLEQFASMEDADWEILHGCLISDKHIGFPLNDIALHEEILRTSADTTGDNTILSKEPSTKIPKIAKDQTISTKIGKGDKKKVVTKPKQKKVVTKPKQKKVDTTPSYELSEDDEQAEDREEIEMPTSNKHNSRRR